MYLSSKGPRQQRDLPAVLPLHQQSQTSMSHPSKIPVSLSLGLWCLLLGTRKCPERPYQTSDATDTHAPLIPRGMQTHGRCGKFLFCQCHNDNQLTAQTFSSHFAPSEAQQLMRVLDVHRTVPSSQTLQRRTSRPVCCYSALASGQNLLWQLPFLLLQSVHNSVITVVILFLHAHALSMG